MDKRKAKGATLGVLFLLLAILLLVGSIGAIGWLMANYPLATIICFVIFALEVIWWSLYNDA